MAKSSSPEPRDDVAARWVHVSTLTAWASNPRTNDAAVLPVANSIKRFGWGAPILAREANGEVVAGHTRLRAVELLATLVTTAKDLDDWHPEALRTAREGMVPVRFGDWNERDAHLLALADNRLNELAEWDAPKLTELMGDYSLDEVEAAGWSSDDLEQMAKDLAGDGKPPPEEPPTPDPPKDPITKIGDVWVLGDHRIICGSCREPADVARLLDGRKVNVAFTSPPYASQRKYDESSGFKPIPPGEYVDWFEAVQSGVRENLADDGSWFVNIKEHCDDGQRSLYVKDLTLAHVRRWGWRFVDELVWRRKAAPGKWNTRLRNDFEPVFQFCGTRPTAVRHTAISYHSDAVPSGQGKRQDHMDGHWNMPTATAPGLALPGNVIDCGAHSTGGHTAAFPVGLPAFFIKAYSDPDDLIFDPFMGSGTTMIAAENEGRHSAGCEISPGYCDIIVQRWEQMTGGKAKLESAP